MFGTWKLTGRIQHAVVSLEIIGDNNEMSKIAKDVPARWQTLHYHAGGDAPQYHAFVDPSDHGHVVVVDKDGIQYHREWDRLMSGDIHYAARIIRRLEEERKT